MVNGLVEYVADSNTVVVSTISSASVITGTRRVRGASTIAATTLNEVLATNTVVNGVLGNRSGAVSLGVSNNNPTNTVAISTSCRNGIHNCIRGPIIRVPLGPGNGLSISNTINASNGLFIAGGLKVGSPCGNFIPVCSNRVTRSVASCCTMDRRVPAIYTLNILISASLAIGGTKKCVLRLLPFARRRVVTGLRRGLGGIQPLASLVSRNVSVRSVMHSILGNFSMRIVCRRRISCGYGYSERGARTALGSLNGSRLRSVVGSLPRIGIYYRFYGAACDFSGGSVRGVLGGLWFFGGDVSV